MANRLVQVCTLIATIVLAVISLVPLFGVHIPESIWGLAIGSVAAIAGNAIAQSVEEFRIRQPKTARAKIQYEAEEPK